MTEERGAPEFSRPLVVANLDEETETTFEANAEERSALARRLEFLQLDVLRADVRIVREIGAMVQVTGRVVADLTQACVVTLEPVSSHLEFDVEVRFAPAELVAEMVADEEISFEEEDPPEVIVDGVIDLGEALAEQLALEIDPFPRAAGAEFPGYSSGSAGENRSASPFAVLEELVKKPK